MTKENVLALIKDHQIQFIDLWFTDIIGVVKSVTIPANNIEQVIDHGSPFDGSSIDGFARVAESDMLLVPDLNTFTSLPWQNGSGGTARMICSIQTPQREAFIGDPRMALQQVLKQAEDMGYRFMTGMELEFFLFPLDAQKRPQITQATDHSSYFDMSGERTQVVRREMIRTLNELGIGVDSTHSEIGYGQHEIDLHYAEALTAADRVLTTRVTLKTIAQKRDLHCTFMPRPSVDLPGSGMHTHQSLHDLNSGANVFADTSHAYGISDIARHFLAGQLCHAQAMCAVLSPLVNSYKRLGTSFEAPVQVTWAHVNRAALIRVPSNTPGRETHARLELRCPDPSSNPYLATAVMLAAGLDGIRQKMPLPEALEETLLEQNRNRRRTIERLPDSLDAALDALEQDDVILSALGPYISDRYLVAKRQEFDAYKQQVTSWELDQYINRF